MQHCHDNGSRSAVFGNGRARVRDFLCRHGDVDDTQLPRALRAPVRQPERCVQAALR